MLLLFLLIDGILRLWFSALTLQRNIILSVGPLANDIQFLINLIFAAMITWDDVMWILDTRGAK